MRLRNLLSRRPATRGATRFSSWPAPARRRARTAARPRLPSGIFSPAAARQDPAAPAILPPNTSRANPPLTLTRLAPELRLPDEAKAGEFGLRWCRWPPLTMPALSPLAARRLPATPPARLPPPQTHGVCCSPCSKHHPGAARPKALAASAALAAATKPPAAAKSWYRAKQDRSVPAMGTASPSSSSRSTSNI